MVFDFQGQGVIKKKKLLFSEKKTFFCLGRFGWLAFENQVFSWSSGNSKIKRTTYECFFGIVKQPFQRLSDLQTREKKVPLDHLEEV